VDRVGRLVRFRRRGGLREQPRVGFRDFQEGALARALLDVERDAVMATDGCGRVVAWNEVAAQTFGWSSHEALGKPLRELFAVAIAGPAPRELAASLVPSGAQEQEIPCRRRDGTMFPGLVRAAPIEARGGSATGVVVSVHDATVRFQTESALRESDARFRNLNETAPQIMWVSGVQGGLEYSNSRLFEYSGRSPVTAEEQTEIVHPDDRALRRDQWDRARATGTPYECEYRMRRHDGEYRWFLGRALPVRDETGQVVRWFGSTTDIHDIKVAQEAIRETDRRKGEFLAVLSHELRNPLAPIKNALHLLGRAQPGGDQARWAQSIIGRQVDQLARLVDDLLDVTRISRGKVDLHRDRLELNDLVGRTIEDYRALFDKRGVKIEYERCPSRLYVDGDWNRLAQVVGNLLQNATKFTESGGTTRVRVWEEGASSSVFVRVADTGIGMTAELLEGLFQPFVQADTALDRRRGGLGLGLALVRGLVELHGGEVVARSDGLGRGSSFTVRLPRASCPPAPAPEQRPSKAAARRRVLIVEDNVDAAASLRVGLELEGHEVAVAHDGVTGVRIARELRPEVVLCDIGLPGMDGYAVAQALRADRTLASTLLVALTGYALPDDLRRASEAGFDRHVAKPPSLDSIEEILAAPAQAR
jgi:PAS domain S-box-containing protein